MATKSENRIDPITTEVVRSLLNAAADEMNVTLIRSAYTPVIYEMKDCAVAILDADHRVFGQSSGLPIFLGNLEEVVDVTENFYGTDCWKPGDIWILNDPYLAGTHLHDMSVYGPVFVQDQLVGFATCRAHWLDVGAKDAGSPTDSTDVFQEGLRLGPTKVIEGGIERPDMVDVLTRNGRFSYPAHGDLYAQIACVRNGQTRLEEIVRRFGKETVEAARDEIFNQTERMERAAVAALPDGIFQAEGCIDNDGVNTNPIWVRVKVIIDGDKMRIDLTDTDNMAGGPVNCGAPQAVSAARVAYKLLISPELPVDGGAFRPLTVDVRPGSLLAAEEPAPCEWYFTPLGLLIDLVVTALADVVPDRAAGAHYGDSMVIGIEGTDPRSGEPFLLYEPTVGGWGGWHGHDGQDALINNVNGALKDVPIEVEETRYAVHVHRYGIRKDSGGPGHWRGGTGVERVYELETDKAKLTLWFERAETPAWGLFGGQSGMAPEVIINEGTAHERRMLKVSGYPIRRGDIVTTRTGGGGGYGNPRDRKPEAVATDIADGYISEAHAQESYGYHAH